MLTQMKLITMCKLIRRPGLLVLEKVVNLIYFYIMYFERGMKANAYLVGY